MILLKIIAESFKMAAKELFSSKMRSFLSLFGISIGILCLISVFSAVDSLEKNIKSSITSLGGDIIYIGKWPWLLQEDYPWWKYIQRPNVSKKDFYALNGTVKSAEAMALWLSVNEVTIKNGSESIEDINVFAITEDYNVVREFEMVEGRYFTDLEFKKESPKIIIGTGIAIKLFGTVKKAVGSKIKIDGKSIDVIGVLKKEGADILGINQGFGLDNTVYVTEIYASTYLTSGFSDEPFILVKAKKSIPLEEVEAELTGRMRMVRQLAPNEDDNFALNKINVFTKAFEPVFSTLFMIGILIGGFSIIVGVFGIANIMFVSVKERTSIIGIKKALGARRIYILLEFFIEAVLLSIFGGIIGLLAVMALFALLNVAMAESGFLLIISQKNMIIGLSVSMLSGVVAGFVPALMASKMKPVDAMRS